MMTIISSGTRQTPPVNRIFIIDHDHGSYPCLAQSARQAIETYHRDTGHGSITKIKAVREYSR